MLQWRVLSEEVLSPPHKDGIGFRSEVSLSFVLSVYASADDGRLDHSPGEDTKDSYPHLKI